MVSWSRTSLRRSAIMGEPPQAPAGTKKRCFLRKHPGGAHPRDRPGDRSGPMPRIQSGIVDGGNASRDAPRICLPEGRDYSTRMLPSAPVAPRGPSRLRVTAHRSARSPRARSLPLPPERPRRAAASPCTSGSSSHVRGGVLGVARHLAMGDSPHLSGLRHQRDPARSARSSCASSSWW